jgi:hypothetical protein
MFDDQLEPASSTRTNSLTDFAKIPDPHLTGGKQTMFGTLRQPETLPCCVANQGSEGQESTFEHRCCGSG